MLDEACRLLLEEVGLVGSAPGGRVEFKRTLVVSFFFKFYLEVLQELKKLAKLCSVPVSALMDELARAAMTKNHRNAASPDAGG